MSSDAELLRRIQALADDDRHALVAFLGFLEQRAEPAAPPAPVDIPRPPSEGVLAAIRRLRQRYPALQSAALLDECAALVSAHLLQGQPAASVIDRLETLFQAHDEASRRP